MSKEKNNGTSINDLYKTMEMITKSDSRSGMMFDSIAMHDSELKDSYSNSVLGIGNNDHLKQFDSYSFDNSTLNWTMWLALYNDSWVFRRIIDKPSQDMTRNGISILGNADFTNVYKALNVLKPQLTEAIKWSKLFGGSVMVLLFKGVSYEQMAEPIKWDLIKYPETISAYVTDRWYGCSPTYDDIVSNLANEDFGKPKYYTIQFSDGTQYKIHHSWVLRFENRDAPNLVKYGNLQGWGYAEGSHVIHEIMRDEKLKTSIASLVDKSLIEVIKMSGMRGTYMMSDKDSEQLQKRLEMVNWGRNYNSLTFLDKDDDYQQHQFSGVAGLADLLQQNMWQIASAVEMQGVLFGDLSNGFSRDEDALERYDERIQSDCESYYRKPLSKLLNILYHINGIKDKTTGKTPEINFTFNSIIASKRNDTIINDMDRIIATCNSLVDNNVMTTEQFSDVIAEYLDTGSINFHFTKENKEDMIEKGKYLKGSQEEIEENGMDFSPNSVNIGNSNELITSHRFDQPQMEEQPPMENFEGGEQNNNTNLEKGEIENESSSN